MALTFTPRLVNTYEAFVINSVKLSVQSIQRPMLLYSKRHLVKSVLVGGGPKSFVPQMP